MHSAESTLRFRFAPILASHPAPDRDPKWRAYGGFEGCREIVAVGIARKKYAELAGNSVWRATRRAWQRGQK